MFLQIVEYNLNKREYTDFSEQLLLNPPKELIDRLFPINCITFDASRNDSMIFSDDNTICVLTKDNVNISVNYFKPIENYKLFFLLLLLEEQCE